MKNLLLPEWFNPWGWVAIAAAVAFILLIIIIDAVKSGKKKAALPEAKADESAVSESENPREETAAADSQIAEVSEPESHTDGAVCESQTVTEEKNDTEAEEKSAAKTTPKQKPAEKRAAAEKETKMEETKASSSKIYHISKRKDDNKWQVKAAGADKALKLFLTQAEAIEFAKKTAGNQEAKIMIHKEDGTFRRLTYKK